MTTLERRNALVTGANRGIGLAMVEHLLRQDFNVVGCSRNEASLAHPRYQHCCADVTSASDVAELMKQVKNRWGGLDALINNAGVARMVPVALMPAKAAQHIMDVNFMGTFLLTNAAFRLLRKSSAGRIVNLTSVAVPLRLEGEAVYAAAKAAVESLTRICAKEFGQYGITCNAIGPTPIRTDLIRSVPEDKLEALVGRQAIPRWATPEDVTSTIDFFLSPQSSMVTGQIIYLGGIS